MDRQTFYFAFRYAGDMVEYLLMIDNSSGYCVWSDTPTLFATNGEALTCADIHGGIISECTLDTQMYVHCDQA